MVNLRARISSSVLKSTVSIIHLTVKGLSTLFFITPLVVDFFTSSFLPQLSQSTCFIERRASSTRGTSDQVIIHSTSSLLVAGEKCKKKKEKEVYAIETNKYVPVPYPVPMKMPMQPKKKKKKKKSNVPKTIVVTIPDKHKEDDCCGGDYYDYSIAPPLYYDYYSYGGLGGGGLGGGFGGGLGGGLGPAGFGGGGLGGGGLGGFGGGGLGGLGGGFPGGGLAGGGFGGPAAFGGGGLGGLGGLGGGGFG